jgi:hypothetical protein
LIEGVEDLIVQHFTSVHDIIELQQHKKHAYIVISQYDSQHAYQT